MTALPPFQQVVEAHGADVWRFAVSQVGPARADDVFQETMLAALRAYTSLRDPGSVRPWLLRIAARKSVDAFRSESRDPVPVEEPDPGVVTQPDPADDELWGRVRALPVKQRQAVALRFVTDLDYAAVGAAMGTSTAAARRNVFEALRTLRTELARAGTTSPPRATGRQPPPVPGSFATREGAGDKQGLDTRSCSGEHGRTGYGSVG